MSMKPSSAQVSTPPPSRQPDGSETSGCTQRSKLSSPKRLPARGRRSRHMAEHDDRNDALGTALRRLTWSGYCRRRTANSSESSGMWTGPRFRRPGCTRSDAPNGPDRSTFPVGVASAAGRRRRIDRRDRRRRGRRGRRTSWSSYSWSWSCVVVVVVVVVGVVVVVVVVGDVVRRGGRFGGVVDSVVGVVDFVAGGADGAVLQQQVDGGWHPRTRPRSAGAMLAPRGTRWVSVRS